MTSVSTRPRVTQCQKPTGWLGRLILRNMNARHSGVTDWGLAHVRVEKQVTILDVGCGGGRTLSKLAAMATAGKLFGVDYSSASIAVATRTNRDWIRQGRVEIREVLRVVKPGGMVAVIGEVYRGAQPRMAGMVEKYLPVSGMKLLTPMNIGRCSRRLASGMWRWSPMPRKGGSFAAGENQRTQPIRHDSLLQTDVAG